MREVSSVDRHLPFRSTARYNVKSGYSQATPSASFSASHARLLRQSQIPCTAARRLQDTACLCIEPVHRRFLCARFAFRTSFLSGRSIAGGGRPTATPPRHERPPCAIIRNGPPHRPAAVALVCPTPAVRAYRRGSTPECRGRDRQAGQWERGRDTQTNTCRLFSAGGIAIRVEIL